MGDGLKPRHPGTGGHLAVCGLSRVASSRLQDSHRGPLLGTRGEPVVSGHRRELYLPSSLCAILFGAATCGQNQ